VEIKTAAKILISILLLIFLLYIAGIQNIFDVIITLDPYLITVALLITVVSMVFRFIRWKIILDACGIRVPFSDITKIFMIGFFFGTITPSKIGNLVKFHYLKKYYKVRTGIGLSVSLLDRAFDLIIIGIISIVGIFLVFSSLESIYSVIISFVIIAAILFGIFNEKIFKKIISFGLTKMKPFKKFVTKSGEINIKDSTDSLYEPFMRLKSVKNFTSTSITSLLVWLTVGIQITVVLYAMGYQVDLFYTTVFICIATLVGLLPITASGFGVREGVFAFLLSTVGLPLEVGVLASLITFILGQLPPALVGLGIYLIYKKKELP